MALAPVGLQATITGVSAFNKGLSSMTRQLTRFAQAAQAAGTQGQVAGRQIGSMASSTSSQINRLGKSVNSAGTGMRLTANLARNLGFGLQQVGFAARQAGLAMSLLVSAPIVAAFGLATKSAVEFEAQMVKLTTLAGLPQAAVADISAEILGLEGATHELGIAIETGVSTNELAAASYFIVSAGIRDAALASDILTSSAKASAVGLGETETIAKAVTAIMTAYGDRVGSAADVTDILLAIVDKATFEADELGTAFGKSLGILANFGVGVEEAGAAIATFSLSGATASESLTGLRRIILSIINPSRSAEEALDAIGTSSAGLQQNIDQQGLTTTLIELRKRLDEAGISATEVFTRETGLNEFLFITGEAAGAYVTNLEAISTANGKLQASFEVVSATTGFQLQQLKASFQVLGVTIGSVFLPAINRIVQALIPFVKLIAQFAAQHPRLVLIATALAAVAAAMGPLILLSGLFIGSLGSIVGALGSVLTSVAAVAGAGGFLAAAGAAAAAVAPFLLVAAVIGTVIAAIVALAGAIAIGLAAGFQHLQKEGENVSGFFTNLASNAFSWGRNIVLQLARGIIAGITFVVQALTALGNIIAGFLAPGSPPALLPDLPEWGQSAIQEFINGFGAADFSVLSDVAGQIESFLRGTFVGEPGQLVPTILGFRDQIANAIAQIADLDVVTNEAIASVVDNLGLANEQIAEYLTTMLQVRAASDEVARIQAEIAAVNEAFEQATRPINDRLEEISDEEEAIRESLEIEELKAIIDDPNADHIAKRLAALKLEEIQLENQLEAEEELRDATLEGLDEELAAAEAELARLEEQAAAQQALMDLQVEHNDLLREQIDLLKSLADSADLFGEGPSIGGVGDIGQPVFDGGAFENIEAPDFGGVGADPFGLDTVLSEAEQTFDELEAGLSGLLTDLQTPIDNLKSAWEGLGEAWSPVAQEVLNAVSLIAEAFKTGDFSVIFSAVGEVLGSALLLGFKLVLAAPGLVVIGLALLAQHIASWVMAQDWGAIWQTMVTAIQTFFSGMWVALQPTFESLKTSLVTWLAGQFETFKNAATPIAEGLKEGIMSLWLRLQPFLSPAGFFGMVKERILNFDWYQLGYDAMTFALEGLVTLSRFFLETLPAWQESVKLWFAEKSLVFLGWGIDVATNIVEGLGKIDDFIKETLPIWWESVKSWLTGNDGNFQEAGASIIDGLISGIESSLGALVAAVQGLAGGARAAWNEFWNNQSPSKLAMEDAKNIVSGLIQGYVSATPALLATVRNMAAAQQGVMAVPSSVAAPSVTTNNSLSFNMGGVTINNGSDEARLRGIIRQEVARAIGQR